MRGEVALIDRQPKLLLAARAQLVEWTEADAPKPDTEASDN
jgi:hypothetical protein